MASKTQTPSPFARISRFLKAGPSSLLAREHEHEKPGDEDWYIPYNGPYEQPPSVRDSTDGDSWGPLVSGWLKEDGRETEEQQGRATRNRAVSSASALTHSSANVDPTRRSFSTTHHGPRPAGQSLGHLDQTGGVGASPMPLRESQEQTRPEQNRHSLANIFAFGQGTRRALTIRHSASTGQLSQEASSSAAVAVRRGSPVSVHLPQEQTLYVRRHPYAFPFSAPATSVPRVSSPPAAQQVRKQPPNFSVTVLDPPRRKSPMPQTPAYLKSAPSSGRGLKASISTPNLRQPAPAPPPRSAPVPLTLPKGKQRWLSPETWCDALILPRPRFAIRVDPGGGSGRIVSPPGSPIWPPVASPFGQPRPATVMDSQTDDEQTRRRGLYESRPSVQQVPAQAASPVAGPSRLGGNEQDWAPGRTGGKGDGTDRHSDAVVETQPTIKAPRPKSFAWDDLALPSPVPSLSKVLEEGRQLEEQRKAWQSQATRSFQNSRARSFSRARAKSLVSSNSRPPPRDAGRSSAMDVIAERTFLGNQTRPPTVHVRLHPSQSQVFRGSEEHGTGVGVNTFTSTGSHVRTRSHAHSNSVGTAASSRNQTDESFMWGGTGTANHVRAQSLGKSALRLVRTTASNAANFCGFASAEKMVEKDHDGGVSMPEASGADALDNALRREGTRVIRLQDQVRREERSREGVSRGVVLITPATPRNGPGASAGPSGPLGVSPVPSTASYSAEGVGIAISTPTPSDEQARKQRAGRERLRMPAHPYAQGATYQHQDFLDSEPDQSVTLPESQSDAAATGGDLTRRRLPVVVHPYAPFAQNNHPYTRAHQMTQDTSEPQEIELPAERGMFAELTPGHIREFQADDLRYSPFIMVNPVQSQDRQTTEKTTTSPRSHPYGPQPKRMSEWGFADALTHTLRGRGSPDSGLGTSESHVLDQESDSDEPALPGVTDRAVQRHAVQEVSEDSSPNSRFLKPAQTTVPSHRRPDVGRQGTHSSSNHTLASSPMENVNPPTFRRRKSSGLLTGHSSSSSPGMVSHESSPPLSPRPLNAPDDLERFRNLFYQPPEKSGASSPEFSRPGVSRHPSESIPFDISSESTRSVSGLTTLARQLAEDLEELRQENRDSVDSNEPVSPMWGRRFGGLRGQRPDEVGPDPNVVLSRTSSEANSPPDAVSPLRFPLDPHASLAQPTINVPEDVELSSRASSELEAHLPDISDEHLRLGTIEALATPPPFASPRRMSSRLSLVHLATRDAPSRESDSEVRLRASSHYSSLGAPTSDVARSSFMTAGTNTSRMSGLSDFPAPPSDVTPEHMSVLNSYFDDNPYSRSQRPPDIAFAPHAGSLVREPSQTTFGRQNDAGQAL